MTDGAQPLFRVLAVCTANISRSPAVERLLRAGFAVAAQVNAGQLEGGQLEGGQFGAGQFGAGQFESVHVESAGVAALVGEPIDPPVASFLLANGVGVTGFAARQLSEPMIRSADLVLALTRTHRTRVLELVPSAVRRSFTLREFARVLESLDLSGLPSGLSSGERLLEILPLATAGRALAPRAATEFDDVKDPFGRGEASYQQSLAVLHQATKTILAKVAR